MRIERLAALEILAASSATPAGAAVVFDELENLLQAEIVVFDAGVSLQAGRPLEELVADEAAPSLAVIGLGQLHFSPGDFAEVGGDHVVSDGADGNQVFSFAEIAAHFSFVADGFHRRGSGSKERRHVLELLFRESCCC